MRQSASQGGVSRNLYWVWFAGAAVWFFDAAFGLHRGLLKIGLLDAAVSAVFLAAGMYFRKQSLRKKDRE